MAHIREKVLRFGWAPRPVWTVRKISPPSVFDPRTVQPVARRYTDWTIPSHTYIYMYIYIYTHTHTYIHIYTLYLYSYMTWNIILPSIKVAPHQSVQRTFSHSYCNNNNNNLTSSQTIVFPDAKSLIKTTAFVQIYTGWLYWNGLKLTGQFATRFVF